MSNTQDQFTVRFWGVRGSYPVPNPACVRTGGNTPCIEVRAGDRVLVLDGGTGAISFGEELLASVGEPGHLTMIISHAHHDHTQGIPFFKPQLVPGWKVHYFGPNLGQEFAKTLREILAPPYFPVTLDDLSGDYSIDMLSSGHRVVIREAFGEPEIITDPSVEIPEDALVIHAFHNPRHPTNGVLNVRVEYRGRSFVYATDVEGDAEGDPNLVGFARDTDLLIHDAMYTREEYEGGKGGVEGYGHSSATMAVATALKAGAKRLALFHHDPGRTDDGIDAIEAMAQQEMPEAFAAREGLVIDLL